MTLRYVVSRLWLFGWFVAWIVSIRKPTLPPVAVSGFTLLFGFSGVITGLYLFVRGFQLLQRKRWIEDTPVSKIAGAALGQIKVFGRATGPYTLLSPLAGVDCYYYRAIAWDGRNAQDDQEFEGRAAETLFTPLFVEDETGRLMIDPRGARLELPTEYDEQISGQSMAECSRRFLQRHGLSTYGETTVSEYAIKPGDPLLVLGTLGESRGLRAMSDAGAFAHPTYLSREAADLQRTEQLEALAVPEGEPREPITNISRDFDLHPAAVLRADSKHHPLILSRQTPENMIATLARTSVFDIWAGPALTLLSLGLLLKWLEMW